MCSLLSYEEANDCESEIKFRLTAVRSYIFKTEQSFHKSTSRSSKTDETRSLVLKTGAV